MRKSKIDVPTSKRVQPYHPVAAVLQYYHDEAATRLEDIGEKDAIGFVQLYLAMVAQDIGFELQVSKDLREYMAERLTEMSDKAKQGRADFREALIPGDF